jgi:hypothetical protein
VDERAGAVTGEGGEDQGEEPDLEDRPDHEEPYEGDRGPGEQAPDDLAALHNAGLAPRGSLASSGHFMPTSVWRMHSVQIGRPHVAHETRVSLLGWR